MSNRQSEDSILIVIFGLIALAVVGLIWKFSNLLGLDFSTGAAIAFRLVLVCASACAVWYFGQNQDRIKIGTILPIFIALIWGCFWPALDFYELQQNSRYFRPDVDTLWWASWYFKTFTFFGLIFIGYLINKALARDWD